jgi:hypothetical protein
MPSKPSQSPRNLSPPPARGRRRQVDDLEEAGVEHVQVLEALAGLVDAIAGVHDATLRRQAVGHELQRVGDLAAGALVLGRIVRGTGGRARTARAAGGFDERAVLSMMDSRDGLLLCR